MRHVMYVSVISKSGVSYFSICKTAVHKMLRKNPTITVMSSGLSQFALRDDKFVRRKSVLQTGRVELKDMFVHLEGTV